MLIFYYNTSKESGKEKKSHFETKEMTFWSVPPMDSKLNVTKIMIQLPTEKTHLHLQVTYQ